MAKVFVEINPKTGEKSYRVEGLQGTGCADLTKVLMQNNEVLDYQQTSEFCAQETQPDYVEEVADALQESLNDE